MHTLMIPVIYKFVPLKNVPDMLNDINTCITNVREWTTSNKLKMNGDKTEIMLVGTQLSFPCSHYSRKYPNLI